MGNSIKRSSQSSLPGTSGSQDWTGLPESVRFAYWLSRHWLGVFVAGYGLFVGLPFLAPVFMHLGWEAPAYGLYRVYSLLCHQLPDRSLFLFGPAEMYSFKDFAAVGVDTSSPLVFRQFIGNVAMGWKVAWSDRMVSLYGGILVAALLWAALRRRLKPLPLWAFALFALPVAIDGVTHLVSDLEGLEQGFRYSNNWLAVLTSGIFPAGVISGNALGSFNSWMRWITGFLFALGIVWYGFPYLEEAARDFQRQIERRIAAYREARDDFLKVTAQIQE